MSVESVSARVTVEKRPVERQFVARPVELRGTGDAKWVKLSPTMVTVVLAGDPALLAEIEPEQVIPFVELKKQPPREGEFYDVSVDAPKGVKVVKTAPPSVTAWYHGPSKGGSTSQSKKR
jgi:hypothetical protein